MWRGLKDKSEWKTKAIVVKENYIKAVLKYERQLLMERITRAVAHDFRAIMDLQEKTAAWLLIVSEDAKLCASHANHPTIVNTKDIQLARRMRGVRVETWDSVDGF